MRSWASRSRPVTRGNALGHLFFLTMASARGRYLPFRSGKVTQYFSVRQVIFSGSRVSMSSENLGLGRALSTTATMRLRSSIPLPMGTSDNRNPSSYSSTAMSLMWLLMTYGASDSTTSMGSSSSEMLLPKSMHTPKYWLEYFLSMAT